VTVGDKRATGVLEILIVASRARPFGGGAGERAGDGNLALLLPVRCFKGLWSCCFASNAARE
jgi:hypothetical protein